MEYLKLADTTIDLLDDIGIINKNDLLTNEEKVQMFERATEKFKCALLCLFYEGVKDDKEV